MKPRAILPPIRLLSPPPLKALLSEGAGDAPDGRLLLAIGGGVFDVSISPQFYAKGSSYHLCAGRRSRVLARASRGRGRGDASASALSRARARSRSPLALLSSCSPDSRAAR